MVITFQRTNGFPCRSLPERLIFSEAATLNDHIFVTGGHASITRDCVYAYDSKYKAQVWLTKASMNHKRCQHTLDVLDGKLCAIGGKILDDDSDVTSVEVYDPESDQWTLTLSDGPNLHGASSLVISNKIYLIGGSKSRQVMVYDADEEKFEHITDNLICDCNTNASAVMTLPRFL